MKNYRFDYAACRMLGHSWPHRRYNIVPLKYGQAEMVLECESCGCERVDTINMRTGEIIKRHYVHPEGYLISGWGDQSPDRNEWRQQTLAQFIKASGSSRLRSVG